MNITEMVKENFLPGKKNEFYETENFYRKDRVRIAIMCDLIEQIDTKIQQLEKRIESLENLKNS